MSVISSGRPRTTSELAVAGALSALTLLITAAAIFVGGITSHGTITAPSFVATTTGTGLTMQGGGSINASSTTSDLWIGGKATTTNLEFTNGTGTNLYLSRLTTTWFTATTATITGIASGHLLPSVTDSYDLGSPALSWNDVYASGTIMAGNGSVSAPAFSSGMDTDTGIYFSGSNGISIATAGSNRLTIIAGQATLVGSFVASANNTYNLGKADQSWADIYASGTLMIGSGSAASPSIAFGLDTDTGLYRVSDNALGFSTAGNARAILTGTIFRAATNNVIDLGSMATSWKDIYASGTIYGASALFSHATTTGSLTTGPLMALDDAGYLQVHNTPITSAARGVRQGGYLSVDGLPLFGWSALSDGAGSYISSSTGLFAYSALSYPVTATTTVATTTLLGVDRGRLMVISNTAGNTTPTQVFVTSTSQSHDGKEICLMGTNDTATVTIADSSEVHTAAGASRVLGDGDEICLVYSFWRSYWYERSYSDN